MGSEDCYGRQLAEIYRIGLVDGTATGLLRKATATAIANLYIVTVAINETNNRRQLMLSLKLRGSTNESWCIKSGRISGGVAGH